MALDAFPYVVVGGGMAGHAAVAAIRSRDPAGPIALLGAEPHAPYRRPPLSKGLWRDEDPDGIWLDVRLPGVEHRAGRRAVAIRRADRVVVDDRGDEVRYGKLLLATGGTARRLPFGGDRVLPFRTVDDYRRLRALADRGAEVAVVGGGFIGSEVAAALATSGLRPTLIFPEATIGARIFPRELGLHLNGLYRDRGVRVLAGASVAGVEPHGERAALLTAGGERLIVDAVVAGIGLAPATELAAAAGLAVEDGIVVDELLRTGDPSILAAGDVARFPSPALGTTLRVEHEDAAVGMGTAAGLTMAGEPTPYRRLPFFYSDLFDLGYEAVGVTDARLEVVADWKVENREGFLYYLSGGRVRGVVCWGIFGKIPEARALVEEPGPFRAADLRGRLAA